ncbi:multiprotein-bridging factor 1 family protein [Kitasatospora sp. NPDC058184]|uniref:helix-turn-helix domain-containing protein n=1 Tax=Kitasatospora sp. NPDC058184 TaxID=3346370 RepID=UPI0036D97211
MEELAHRAEMDAATVYEIIRGRLLPSEEELRALLKAMDVGARAQQRALLLHQEAMAELRTRMRMPTRTPPAADWRVPVPPAGEPDPVLFSTVQEFVAGLEDVRVWAGEPSLRHLEERSARLHQQRQTAYGKVLRRSTISDMLNATSLPQMEKVRHFLQICGVRDIDAWVYTWRRVRTIEKAALRRAA